MLLLSPTCITYSLCYRGFYFLYTITSFNVVLVSIERFSFITLRNLWKNCIQEFRNLSVLITHKIIIQDVKI